MGLGLLIQASFGMVEWYKVHGGTSKVLLVFFLSLVFRGVSVFSSSVGIVCLTIWNFCLQILAVGIVQLYEYFLSNSFPSVSSCKRMEFKFIAVLFKFAIYILIDKGVVAALHQL